MVFLARQLGHAILMHFIPLSMFVRGICTFKYPLLPRMLRKHYNFINILFLWKLPWATADTQTIIHDSTLVTDQITQLWLYHDDSIIMWSNVAISAFELYWQAWYEIARWATMHFFHIIHCIAKYIQINNVKWLCHSKPFFVRYDMKHSGICTLPL